MEVTEVKLQTPSDLARIVKNARVKRNLTQQDVAEAVGITRQSLARLEQGNGGTSFDTVLLILDHLGIQIATATDQHTSASTRSTAQAAAEALTKRLNSAFVLDGLASLNQDARARLPKIDLADISKRVTSSFSTASLASRALTEHLRVPGSVITSYPPVAETAAHAPVETQTSASRDDAGGTE